MKILKTNLFPLIISFLIVSCTSVTENQEQPYVYSPDEELVEALDEVLENQIALGRIAGGVVMVSKGDTMITKKAWGWNDREEEKPMETDDLFRIASMTKVITSTAILQLYEDGNLSLDDPVEKYIPEFSDPVVLTEFDEESGEYETRPASRGITIHDLLTHTSGVAYGFTNGTFSQIITVAGVPDLGTEDSVMIEETMAILGNLPLAHDPGEQFTYGLNTDVLGRVVEVASGLSLADYFDTYIFEPLNLNDIGFYHPGRSDDLTSLYTIQDSTLVPYPKDSYGLITPDFPVSGAMMYYSGGAGLTSSTADYHSFLSVLYNGGAWNTVQILEEETVEMMTSNQIGELDLDGNKFGYGLMITTEKGYEEGKRSVGSLSWGGAFQSTYWMDPQYDMVVVLMTQVLPSMGQADFYEDFEQAIYESVEL